jgi:hypothetical protein
MVMATLILVLSTAMFFFYLQSVGQKILRRQFAESFWQAIAQANRFEFPAIRQALKNSSETVDYAAMKGSLQRDFLTLTYLAKNAANVNQRHSREERFLIGYFKFSAFMMVARHALKLGEKPSALKMTAILQYFANVVGERANAVRFGNLTAADYLLNL